MRLVNRPGPAPRHERQMTSHRHSALDRVQEVLDRLLDPENGCPWDRQQTPDTLRLYILEETYELLDAVEAGDLPGIREELGDCLFLICFMARLFQDQQAFDLDDVLNRAADKMIARHPHVFAHGPAMENAEAVRLQWHQLKNKEKNRATLGGVPSNLPGLLRAHRLTERAGRVGFDWPGPEAVLDTLNQELDELKQSLHAGGMNQITAELGDVLFTIVNLARHLKINAEGALRGANDRFVNRFQYIEEKLAARGQTPDQADLSDMDRLWEEAKKQGR